MFTKEDEKFIKMVLKYADVLEDVIVESLEYDIKLTTKEARDRVGKMEVIKNDKRSEKDYIMLGSYIMDKKKFVWFEPVNKSLLKHMPINRYMDTIKKLFINEVEIAYKLHKVIPYFVALLFPDFNLVRFSDPNNKMNLYFLIKLDIKNKFDTKDFFNKIK